jgi:predicted flap endonuclease-1-like 5' DNA nuclease
MSVETDLPKGIGAPAQRALAGAGIQNLEQLSRFNEAQIKNLHGIGPKALNVLRQALAEKGLAFADPTAPAKERDIDEEK